MDETWFISDTHFGHKNVLKLSNRPFSSIEEHDEVIFENWNKRVKKNDTIIHLGDFGFLSRSEIGDLLERLNGKKILIRGNHDKNAWKADGWSEKHTMMMMGKTFHPPGLVLCHYPILEWAGIHRGSIHLYGHVHGKIKPNNLSCDIGVDCWDYKPVNWEEIKEFLDKQEFYDPRSQYK